MKGATLASLGALLRLERRPATVHPDHTYSEIGIYSFGRGIFHKQPRTGLEVGEKDLYLIREGDFILQVTFAWEGAVALASSAEEGMYGSVRFPTFRVVESRCYPPYLNQYFRTRAGRDQLARISPGSAGRNRVLSLKRVPDVMVPLPPLEEQRRIVARIEALAAKVEEVRRLQRGTHTATEALKLVAAGAVLGQGEASTHPTVTLAEVAEIRAGVTLGRTLAGPTVRLPYLRVANVQDGRLDLTLVKEIDVLPEEVEKWRLQPGDVLLTEGGDWDKLGRGTVWRGEIANCIHQNHIFRVRVNAQVVDPEFFAAVLGSLHAKDYFRSASKQTTNLASINQRQLRAFTFRCPLLSEQRRIITYLNEVQARVDSVERLQTGTVAELEALLPSILDRAFKGEL